MSEGMQIEIPSLDDDDDFLNPAIPFGRPQNFQFGQQSFSSSPTNNAGSAINANWDLPSESPNAFHSRGDSYASENSSFGHGKPGAAFSTPKSSSSGHGASQSVTAHPAPTRKSSFASIKSALKISKSAPQDVPPVPSLVSHPVLRNPFNRSDSARAQPMGSPAAPPPRRRPSAPGPSVSYQSTRSPQVSSSVPYGSHVRGISNMSGPANRKGSRGGAVGHSPASSITQSDQDHTMNASFSGTPIPRVPNASASFHRPAPSFMSETIPEVEPSTPAEYALNVVLTHFVTNAERRIEAMLTARLDYEAVLSDAIGPGADAEFDTVLESLGRVALKQAKLVIDAITRWRRTQTTEHGLPDAVMREHMPEHVDRARRLEIRERLVRRREMTSTYIYGRALISVVSTIGKDSLDDIFAVTLQDMIFYEFKRAEDSSAIPSPNKRAIADIFALVLSHLAKSRFLSVTDHFVDELKPVSDGLVPRDGDPRFEHLVTGLRPIEMKVWPHERFEEAAELIEALAKAFQNAHGPKLKSTFAETLTFMLHPINKDAQEELDEPMWAQAIETIHAKAMTMLAKQRYWSIAYPLAVTSLCVSAQDYFLRNWSALCDLSYPKLKADRNSRTVAFNGLTRLLWTYLFRCNKERDSVKSTKIEAMMRSMFPQGRRAGDDTEPLVYICHFIISRPSLEYGHDLIMELMQESDLEDNRPNLLDILFADRIAIGIRAGMLSFPCLVNGTNPSWPSGSDFNSLLSPLDYPSEATSFPEETLEGLEIAPMIQRFSAAVAKLGRLAIRYVGNMSVLDARYRFEPAQHTTPQDEQQLIVRHHPDGTICSYPKSLLPQIDLLRSCFEAWPRALHSTLPPLDVLDGAIRAVAHAEPSVAEAATQSLLRFAAEHRYVNLVLKLYNHCLFSPSALSADPNWRIVTEHIQRVELWVKLVHGWAEMKDEEQLETEKPPTPDPTLPDIPVLDVLDEIEAGGLFLLASTDPLIRPYGLRVLRIIPKLRERHATSPGPATPCIIDILTGKTQILPMPIEGSLALSDQEAVRMNKWRESKLPDYLIRLLESDNALDHLLWSNMLPSLVRECMIAFPMVLDICRDSFNAAVLRYHPMISALAGMSSKPIVATARGPVTPSRGPVLANHEITHEQRHDVGQWRVWIMALCACAVSSEEKSRGGRDHARLPSDTSGSRERLSTAKGLFRHLIPFLASEHSLFRDAVVGALGSTHASTFRSLLDDLRSITTHIYDDGKSYALSKPGARRTREQDRVHIAVVRVYALTAEFINNSTVNHDTTTVSLLWSFVQKTQTFLSRQDVRIDWELSRLRRYFCHIVEQLFSVPDERLNSVIPRQSYLSLYRLCDEWCPYGSSTALRDRHAAVENALNHAVRNPQDRRGAFERFKEEESVLGPAAASAMARLCAGAFFCPQEQPSPGKSMAPPLGVMDIVDWISAVLGVDGKNLKTVVTSGRIALRALLVSPQHNGDLMMAIVRRSFVTSQSPASALYYDEAVDAIANGPRHHFTFHQSLWLGLVHMGRSDVDVRCKALRALKASHLVACPPATIARIESMVRSTAPTVFFQAQRQVSALLASANPQAACGILAECTLRLPQTRDGQERLALLSLEPWVPNLSVLSENGTLSLDGYGALHNLFSLTVRYGDNHADALQLLWSTLVAENRASYCRPVIAFLLEEAAARANPAFVVFARKIVAYLSRTPLGPAIFDHLCSVLEPSAMVVPTNPKASVPPGDDAYFVENLDGLLPLPKSRQHLSTAELAVAYMSDSVPDAPWEHDSQLPTLLHVVVTLVDHRNIYVRSQMRRYLFQILRSWCIGYFHIHETPESSIHVFKVIDDMEDNTELFWSQSSKAPADVAAKLRHLCEAIVEVLQPIHPDIRRRWAETAVMWGNRCPVRDSACRSLQIFRVLSIDPQPHMVTDMMERLSSTVSDTSNSDSKFAKEIILSLIEYSKVPTIPPQAVAALFWCATATLSTVVEPEFLLAIQFMDAVLDAIDIRNPATVELLRANKPLDWTGADLCVERLVFFGLRSSETVGPTYDLLSRIAEAAGHDVVETDDSRLRHLYTACLPSALRSIEDGVADNSFTQLVSSIALLAEDEGRTDISRIMTSVAKGRFKRKEDFLRQAASALRDNYWSDFSTEIMTVLLGCLLNSDMCMRGKALHILKALLQNIDSRNPFQLAGSELLLPLLRLLSTDMASEAMEVLDTPMIITGGPSASHVVRMSMHGLLSAEAASEVAVFGTPSASGWCVAGPDDRSRLCRRNVAAVVSSSMSLVKHPSGTMSTILFAREEDHHPSRSEPDIIVHRSQPSADTVSLGELVNTLHDLNTFFQSDFPAQPARPTQPDDQDDAARRVAAILSRSLARPGKQDVFDAAEGNNSVDPAWTIPPTPFVDLFSSPPSFNASDALQRNFMRTAEESDGEDDAVRSDTANDHHDQGSYFGSQNTTPRSRSGHGHDAIDDWDSDEELEASFSMETPNAQASWGLPRRNSVRKVKEMLSPRRSPKQDRR